MIRPMPFCPSFEPCANDTPVQVRISRPRIHGGGGLSEVGAVYSVLLRITNFITSSISAESTNPTTGLNSSARNTPIACDQSTPEVAGSGRRHELVGQADTDDRADQRVRRTRRQPEPPGAEVPDDGSDQQREDHRETRAAADLKDQLHRQQATAR